MKWGTAEYTGQLVSVDSYMNIQLNNAEEFMDGKSAGSLGQVLIRYEDFSRDMVGDAPNMVKKDKGLRERRERKIERVTRVAKRRMLTMWFGAGATTSCGSPQRMQPREKTRKWKDRLPSPRR